MEPDEEAYNQAISAHAKARRLDRAAALYTAARAAGLRLESVTYSTYLSALEKLVPYYDGHEPVALGPDGGRPPWLTPGGAAAAEHVRRLWRDMGKAEVRPTTFTHRAIVASLSRAGDLEGAAAAAAEQAAAQPGGGGPPAIIGSHLVLGCVWVGAWARARAGLADLAAADPSAGASLDPARVVVDAIRTGTAEGFAFALDAAVAMRPNFWAPGVGGRAAAPRTMPSAEELAASAAAGNLKGGGSGAAARPAPDLPDRPVSTSAAPSLFNSWNAQLRLLAAAHDLGRAEEARTVWGWMVEERWRPEARAVGLVARTLAKAGRAGEAVAFLRSVRAPSIDARFGAALADLEVAAAAEAEGADEAAAEAAGRALAGALAGFAPPPGWHLGSRGVAAMAAAGQAGRAPGPGSAAGRGSPPAPPPASSPRRLAPSRAPPADAGAGAGVLARVSALAAAVKAGRISPAAAAAEVKALAAAAADLPPPHNSEARAALASVRALPSGRAAGGAAAAKDAPPAAASSPRGRGPWR